MTNFQHVKALVRALIPAGTLVEKGIYGWWLRRSSWLDDYVQPSILKAFATAYPKAVVLQVGANDGKMADPLLRVLLAYRWSATLVEAVPEIFERLEKRHKKRSNITPVNVAVSESEGTATFYSLVERDGRPELPVWATGLGSFSRDVILRQQHRVPNIEDYIEQCDVQCITYEKLCQQQGIAGRVDLLATDTEGHDAVIVNQVDLAKNPPKLIIYEHHHLAEADDEALVSKLKAAGYATHKEGLDTVCLKLHGDGVVADSVRAVWDDIIQRVSAE